MPAQRANPSRFHTAPPVTNAPIDQSHNHNTKTRKSHHHCPNKLNGSHSLTKRCLTNNHVGYCETCKYLASQYLGCHKCGSHRLSKVPPSQFSRVMGQGHTGAAQNELVTGNDILCKDDNEEDGKWTKEQERKAREEDKVREAATKEKANKSRAGLEEINEVKIGETEKAQKRQQGRTKDNRLKRAVKGLIRRK